MSLDTIKDALRYYSDTESWPVAKPVIERLLATYSEADIIGEMAVLSLATKKQWKVVTLRWRMEQPKQQPQPPQEAPREVTPFGLEMSRFCVIWGKVPRPFDEATAARFWSERAAIMRKHGVRDGGEA